MRGDNRPTNCQPKAYAIELCGEGDIKHKVGIFGGYSRPSAVCQRT
jgi:hypothetical protein